MAPITFRNHIFFYTNFIPFLVCYLPFFVYSIRKSKIFLNVFPNSSIHLLFALNFGFYLLDAFYWVSIKKHFVKRSAAPEICIGVLMVTIWCVFTFYWYQYINLLWKYVFNTKMKSVVTKSVKTLVKKIRDKTIKMKGYQKVLSYESGYNANDENDYMDDTDDDEECEKQCRLALMSLNNNYGAFFIYHSLVLNWITNTVYTGPLLLISYLLRGIRDYQKIPNHTLLTILGAIYVPFLMIFLYLDIRWRSLTKIVILPAITVCLYSASFLLESYNGMYSSPEPVMTIYFFGSAIYFVLKFLIIVNDESMKRLKKD